METEFIKVFAYGPGVIEEPLDDSARVFCNRRGLVRGAGAIAKQSSLRETLMAKGLRAHSERRCAPHALKANGMATANTAPQLRGPTRNDGWIRLTLHPTVQCALHLGITHGDLLILNPAKITSAIGGQAEIKFGKIWRKFRRADPGK